MKIDQYCQRQYCKHIEMEQFLTFFRVARVCQRQLGFLVYSTPVSVVSRNGSSRVCQCLYTTTYYDLVTARRTCYIYEWICVRYTVLLWNIDAEFHTMHCRLSARDALIQLSEIPRYYH